ncbi:MAG: polyphosphate kinase 1 [Actinomycetota bacterium]
MTARELTIDTGEPSTSPYLNRELSWLDFNARVLAQAEDARLPLLERIKFCAIYATNLDEFFMVRVAGLKDQVAGGVTSTPPDGLSPLAQLSAIRTLVDGHIDRLDAVVADDLFPALADGGIHLCSWDDLTPADRKLLTGEFESHIFPILTPQAFDPGHPFPYISNQSLNLGVLVEGGEPSGHRFARLKVPPSVPRLMALPDHRFVPVEQVIAAHLDLLFPGMTVLGGWPFRVTRNADLALDDEDAGDLLEAVELELRRRRFGRAIRLEIGDDMPEEVRDLLQRELDLEGDDLFAHRAWLDASCYWELQGVDRNDLKAPMTPGAVPRRMAELETSRDLFARLAKGDLLLHHPYESFSASVSEFVRMAAIDPQVLAIKITLYRTSGDSPIVDALIQAAERGKQVAVLIELKARFDEEANITWARRLEEAGVHVVYGFVGLKIHAKTVLVIRAEPEGVRRYCHVGTGNYNPKTARIYEDVGILTADRSVGEDLTQLFNYLTGYGRDIAYQRLLVAPTTLRSSFDRLIANEMEAPEGTGRITLKMNSLVDARLIDRLYEASQAGVSVDLIVRGICCLRPGVPGLSDNVRVRSIVGRNLEHSRIYHFANGGSAEDDGGPGLERFYIGSADLMPRNLDRRVEVLLRVDDEYCQDRLRQILKVNLADTELAWDMGSDGGYTRLDGTFNAHDEFERLAGERAAGPTSAGAAGADAASDRRRLPPARTPATAGATGDEGEAAAARSGIVRAAGCLVYRQGSEGPEVLVVHRPRYDDWDFPKGKREPGESDLECAIRETEEESGQRGEVIEELPADRYLVEGREKVVRWWLLRWTGGTFESNDEVDVMAWLSPADAAARLSYPHARRLLGYLPDR